MCWWSLLANSNRMAIYSLFWVNWSYPLTHHFHRNWRFKMAPAPEKNKFDINSIFLHFPPKKGKNHQEIGHHIVFFTTPKNGNTRHNFHRCVFSIHHTKPWVRSASHTPRNQRFTQALEPMARWHVMGNSIVWPRAFYDIRILGIPSIQPSRTWHTMHFNRFRPVAIHIKAFQRSDRLTAMVNSITHPLETNAEASMKSLKAETTKRWATYYSRGMSLQTKKKEIRVHLQENFVFPIFSFLSPWLPLHINRTFRRILCLHRAEQMTSSSGTNSVWRRRAVSQGGHLAVLCHWSHWRNGKYIWKWRTEMLLAAQIDNNIETLKSHHFEIQFGPLSPPEPLSAPSMGSNWTVHKIY